MLGSLLKPRVGIFFTIYLFIFFLIYSSLHSIASSAYWQERNHSQQQQQHELTAAESNARQAAFAQSTVKELQVMLQKTFEEDDFAGMGDRVAGLAALGKNMMENPALDRTSFFKLLDTTFPWWDLSLQNQSVPAYLPWNNPESASNETTGTEPSTGLVICVGHKNLQMATHLIMSLRNTIQSKLPIEIFYAGDDDLPPSNRTFLKSLNADLTIVDLLEYFDDDIAGLSDGGFAQKPFALLASSFQQAIIVDADVIFLSTPDNLFNEHPDLLRTGTLFFHDRAYRVSYGSDSGSRRDWIKNIVTTSSKNNYVQRNRPSISLTTSLFWRNDLWQEMESGVVAYDKARIKVFFSLLFAAWMNSKKIREDVTWQHFYGDKETYWMAAELSGTEYAFQDGYAGMIGRKETSPFFRTGDKQGRLCGTHLAHAKEPGSDEPFWFNGGLVVNKAQERTGGLKLHTFEDWIPGSNIMDQQPNWWYKGNEVWCAQGTVVSLQPEKGKDDTKKQMLGTDLQTQEEKSKKVPKKVPEVIAAIMEQAELIETFFEYGNWTGPPQVESTNVGDSGGSGSSGGSSGAS